MIKNCIKRPLFLISILLLLPGCVEKAYKFRTDFAGAFDTVTVITGYAKTEAEFSYYAGIIKARMEELHCLYNIYQEYEGLNNLYTINKNAGIAPVKVNEDIIGMLLAARESFHLTGGVVNIAMGPVLTIWHDYREAAALLSHGPALREASAALPSMPALREAAQLTDINDLIIDEVNSTVFLQKKNMSLDVGAVAKGYAVELAASDAKRAGMVSALISAGGNVTAISSPLESGRSHWNIGIQNPDSGAAQSIIDAVSLSNSTVSCSGGYQRYYTVGGKSYSHIIDPASLMPAELYKQVTVIHSDACLADILSTALFILPYEEGAALAESSGAQALWIGADGEWKATDGYIEISETWGE